MFQTHQFGGNIYPNPSFIQTHRIHSKLSASRPCLISLRSFFENPGRDRRFWGIFQKCRDFQVQHNHHTLPNTVYTSLVAQPLLINAKKLWIKKQVHPETPQEIVSNFQLVHLVAVARHGKPNPEWVPAVIWQTCRAKMSTSKRDIYCLKYDDIMGVYIRIYIYTYMYSNLQQYTRDSIICAYVYTYINTHSVIYVCANICYTSMYVECRTISIYLSEVSLSNFSFLFCFASASWQVNGKGSKGSIVKVTTTWANFVREIARWHPTLDR